MSSTQSRSTKAALLAHVQALIAGTQKHFPNGNFTLGNVAFTTQSLVTLLQSLANAIESLNAAQAMAKDALSALKGIEAKVNPVLRLYKRFILAAFGDATQELSDFGLLPPKARKPRTSEQNAAAAKKAVATREARGTKSRKAKSAIHGDVTGVVITPVTATAAASSSTPPAKP